MGQDQSRVEVSICREALQDLKEGFAFQPTKAKACTNNMSTLRGMTRCCKTDNLESKIHLDVELDIVKKTIQRNLFNLK